jgi:hypothetical protein
MSFVVLFFPVCRSAMQLQSTQASHGLSTTSSRPLSRPLASFNSSNATEPPPMLPTMRLYQLVSPALVGRAAAFGSKLSLPSTWRPLDAPVFDAPGVETSAVAASLMNGKQHQPTQAAAASAAAGSTGSHQTAAGHGKGGHAQQQQQQQQQQCSISIAVAVVEGADVLRQVPQLARWVWLRTFTLL